MSDITKLRIQSKASVRDSINSPIQIAEVSLPGVGAGPYGRIGLTLCPGKKDPSRLWSRDLEIDLQAIRQWGAIVVVTLMEAHEMKLLQVENMPLVAEQLGLRWLHLPIRDVDVPDERFAIEWKLHGPALHQLLDSGKNVLVHCRGGLGRSGLVAAQMLVERGTEPANAIRQVRSARPGAIETRQQEAYVHICLNMPRALL